MSEELRFLINSLLVISFLLAAYLLSVRFGPKLRTRRKGEIEVMDVYPLDRESSLLLFRVRDRVFLCYHSKGRMEVLKEWSYERNSNSNTAPDTAL